MDGQTGMVGAAAGVAGGVSVPRAVQFPSQEGTLSLTCPESPAEPCCSHHQVFKEEKYLKEALECSDVIWQRGLLRKGYGVCHGTAGNGYSFLSLYHLTQDKKYLYRACKVRAADPTAPGHSRQSPLAASCHPVPPAALLLLFPGTACPGLSPPPRSGTHARVHGAGALAPPLPPAFRPPHCPLPPAHLSSGRACVPPEHCASWLCRRNDLPRNLHGES